MKTIFAALLGLSVAFAASTTSVNAQETTEQKIERLKREDKEYLEKKKKDVAEAKEQLKAALAEANKKYTETKERLEKTHAEKCTAVRGDCTALYPDATLKRRACLVWHGCLR